MDKTIRGKAFVMTDNIDTDQIIPAEYLSYNPTDPDERKFFGMYALSGVPDGQSGLPGGDTAFVEEGSFHSHFQRRLYTVYVPNPVLHSRLLATKRDWRIPIPFFDDNKDKDLNIECWPPRNFPSCSYADRGMKYTVTFRHLIGQRRLTWLGPLILHQKKLMQHYK